MKIVEIKEKSIWEDFLLHYEEKTFLQSWNWGEFQERMGNKIWKFGVYNDGYPNDGYPISIILAVKVRARRGTFLLVQHGPTIQNSNLKSQNYNSKFKIFETLLDKLKEIAKNEEASFIRMASLWEKDKENKKIFKDLGFREAPMHANAYEATWKLDLAPSEKELLAQMRKTTRYLIRQAEKNPDIKIEKSENLSDASLYQKLNEEVAKRQQFTPFPAKFIENEFDVFSKDRQALWLFGRYKGEVAAGALVIFWQGIGFYHQAASLPQFAKFSIPYVLQWEAIKEAKKRGCKLYDFWGYVDPKSHHPWAGPTLFKMGFGGKAYEYVKTQDLSLSWRYWPTYLFETFRKIKRRL